MKIACTICMFARCFIHKHPTCSHLSTKPACVALLIISSNLLLNGLLRVIGQAILSCKSSNPVKVTNGSPVVSVKYTATFRRVVILLSCGHMPTLNCMTRNHFGSVLSLHECYPCSQSSRNDVLKNIIQGTPPLNAFPQFDQRRVFSLLQHCVLHSSEINLNRDFHEKSERYKCH